MLGELEAWAATAPAAVGRRLDALIRSGLSSVEMRRARALQQRLAPIREPTRQGEVWVVSLIDGGPAWLDGLVIRLFAPSVSTRVGQVPAESWDRVHGRALSLLGLADRGAVRPVLRPSPGCLPTNPPGGGRSAELAALVATVSDLTGCPPLHPVIVAGEVHVIDGRLLALPALGGERKQAVARLELPDAHLVLVDKATAVDQLLDQVLGPGWRRATADDAERLLRDADKANRDARYQDAQILADRALAGPEGQRPSVRARARWAKGAALLHQGQAGAARRLLERAREDFAEWGAGDCAVRPETIYFDVEVEAHLGIAMLDDHHLEIARGHLEGLLGRVTGDRPPVVTWPWQEAALRAAGSLARVSFALGQPDVAERLRLDICLGLADLAQERPRSLGDLAEEYRKQGRLDQAEVCLEDALAELRRCPWMSSHAVTERFLVAAQARLRADRGDWQPQPLTAVDRAVPALCAIWAAHQVGDPALSVDEAAARVLPRLDGPPVAAWAAVADGVLRRWARGEAGGDTLASKLAAVACDHLETQELYRRLAKPSARALAADALRRRSAY